MADTRSLPCAHCGKSSTQSTPSNQSGGTWCTCPHCKKSFMADYNAGKFTGNTRKG